MLEQTTHSAILAFPKAGVFVCDVGSDDGSEDLACVSQKLRSTDGNHTPGAGFVLLVDWLIAQPDLPGVVVFSDDDMLWKPGAGDKLERFWAEAPEDVALVSGLLEPDWHWNTPREVVEAGGVRVLVRDSAPAAAWSMRCATAFKLCKMAKRDFGFDSDICSKLRAMGLRVAQMDLAEHVGEGRSTHDNSPRECYGNKPLDRAKWGI